MAEYVVTRGRGDKDDGKPPDGCTGKSTSAAMSATGISSKTARGVGSSVRGAADNRQQQHDENGAAHDTNRRAMSDSASS
jgi:hypothetical protein